MRSVAIPTQLYYERRSEIDDWLYMHKAVTKDSIIHPYLMCSSCVVFTFEDPELALLFRLSWG